MILESDPHGINQHAPGAKLDEGKVMAGLLLDFSLALEEVAKVCTYGAKHYSVGGWMAVPNAVVRYNHAAWRHLLKTGSEAIDPQSGLSHQAHEIWNRLATLELKLREGRL